MGEVPIYTCKAHVFLIDPDTKKSWVPASRTAVPVNFFYDSARRSYRIISVDGTKAIINSTMMPEMVFTKTSAKFGQWADIRAGTVYGLGFNTDSLLNKFLENFNDIRDRALELKGQADMKEVVDSEAVRENEDKITQQQQQQQHVNFRTSKDVVLPMSTPTKKPPMIPNGGGGGNPTQPLSSTMTNTTNTSSSTHDHHHHHHHEHDDQRSESDMTKLSATPSHTGSTTSTTTTSVVNEVKNLRHQNERLRQAIAQSNANAKKWENEMQSLKSTNSRLTAALQESMTSVDQWHRQLASYKEENEKLKRKLGEVERTHKHDAEGANEQLEHVRRQMDQLQLENGEKIQECNLLQQRVGLLAVIERQHNDCSNRLKKTQEENTTLKNRLQAFEERIASLSRERNQRQRLVTELQNRISDLSDVTQQLKATN